MCTPLPGPRWGRRAPGPSTMEKLMDGEAIRPTLNLLAGAPYAIRALTGEDSSESVKILRVASAWGTFLQSASAQDKEEAHPSFARFVDEVATLVGRSRNAKNAHGMLLALTLPNLLMYDSVYVLDAVFRIFAMDPSGEKRLSALAHLEAHRALLYGEPSKVSYHIFGGMLEFYEQLPGSLDLPASRECACAISGFLMAQSNYLLHIQRPDLLAYGIAWGPSSLECKLSRMEEIADNFPASTQAVLFSKVAELVPMMPVHNGPMGDEFYSEQLRAEFPEFHRALLGDALLYSRALSSRRQRLYAEAQRLLSSAGVQVLPTRDQFAALH